MKKRKMIISGLHTN